MNTEKIVNEERQPALKVAEVITSISTTKIDQVEFLRSILAKRMEVTSWHWNDDFWEFWKTFYDGKTLDQARRALSYYMKKLVDCGDAYPSKRHGIGAGGGYEFGVNYQTIWEIKNMKLREDFFSEAKSKRIS